MYNIKLMNKIAKVGTDVFDKEIFNVGDEVAEPTALMVRSAKLNGMTFDQNTVAIARAGAGVNNIDCDDCANAGIVVFNTPGANANAVKELTLAALILASRDVVGGIEWANTLAETDGGVAKAVEKGKSAFAGNELLGKTLGVIGLGAIGGLVANSATKLGMKVIGYDPHLSVNAAWNLSGSIIRAESYDEVYRSSDYLTLHVPSTPDTKGMINERAISLMKDGAKIINMARADLVNIAELKSAIAVGKISKYVTDFPTEDTVRVKNIINIPHLGASTEESEESCAVMAARELCDFVLYGNIKNSVNYPAVSIAPNGAPSGRRIAVCHKNVANVLAPITSVISGAGLNIENLSNGSKGEFAYTLIETDKPISSSVSDTIVEMVNVIRVRVI